jgi:hypothetical protein
MDIIKVEKLEVFIYTLYRYFDLADDEIQLIEETMRTMDK